MLPTKFRFIWPSGFRGEDFFKYRPIRNNNCLWRPCLLMDRDEISYLYRGPSIDASYQVSVHLAKRFQRRMFRNQPIRNKNCLWWPCLSMDQDNMNTLNRGSSIDACFLPSFSSFALEVSEEKIKMWKVNGQQTRDGKWWKKLNLSLASWANKRTNNDLHMKLKVVKHETH